MEIPEILKAFKFYDGIYKREYVEAAVKLRDEIISHLIRILEKLVLDPTPYIQNDDYFGHIYAVILLEYFGDPRTHQVLVDVLNIPGDVTDRAFGDIIEDFSCALFRTCGGSLDKIKSVVLNKDADELCRGFAAQAMVYAAVDGMVPREEVLEFFGSLFTGNEAEPDSYFWSYLVDRVCDLYPEESMSVIRKAYQDGLIDPGYIVLEDFEEALERGKEYALEQVRKEMKAKMPANVHEYMSWWPCFRSKR